MQVAEQHQAEAFLQSWLHSRGLARSVNLQVMQDEGLSATLLTILNLLDRNHPITAVALASRMNVHPSTIVRSLDALEERGYITRHRNPADRRELQVTLATAGQKVQERLHAAFLDHIRNVFERMPMTSRKALLSSFRRFVDVSSEVLQETRKEEKDNAHS